MTLGNWVVRFVVVLSILYAMADTYEEGSNGIKVVSAISIAIILFSFIPKMATYLGWI